MSDQSSSNNDDENLRGFAGKYGLGTSMSKLQEVATYATNTSAMALSSNNKAKDFDRLLSRSYDAIMEVTMALAALDTKHHQDTSREGD